MIRKDVSEGIIAIINSSALFDGRKAVEPIFRSYSAVRLMRSRTRLYASITLKEQKQSMDREQLVDFGDVM